MGGNRLKRQSFSDWDAAERLAAIATARYADYLDEQGHIDPAKVREPGLADAVECCQPIYSPEGVLVGHRLKLYDATRAIELLGLAAAGVPTRPADKAVLTGIQAVQLRLAAAGDGRPRLLVSRACANLIGEFYEYRWADPKEGANAREEPVKAHDHAMDALRYMVMEADCPARYEAEPLAIPDRASATGWGWDAGPGW